jgi:hypothetical protein
MAILGYDYSRIVVQVMIIEHDILCLDDKHKISCSMIINFEWKCLIFRI